VTREHRDELILVCIARAWNSAPDGNAGAPDGALDRITLALTPALVAEGLAADGKLTDKARTMIRRVDARMRKLKKAGAS
jgi:hypothetical protein